ncbi:putative serine/threonine-protein kinase receptor [Triticum dicoccoides]|uniref:putative serine/threonine-protein kinase receptor n=1 Tax=Triticum dicoccoides TaxID=85692 RepID=UPI00188E2EA3|nr:putative serine/threonine-protein kinase receptor [Triticum dicoccoides]
MKIPDKFVYVRNRGIDQCRAECSRNCDCTAYAYANLQNGSTSDDMSRCLIWLGELVDTGKFRDGENLYLHIASSTVDKESNVLKIVLPIIASILILTCVSLVWICKSRVWHFLKSNSFSLESFNSGYMSPEYAMEGSFFVKSDTYSFGILLLEIAWSLWVDGNASELVDRSVVESCPLDEVL